MAAANECSQQTCSFKDERYHLENTIMKLQLCTIALTLALSGNTFAGSNPIEDKTQHEETNQLVGLGSGILVGAAVAGPIGAVVAGIFGLLIADDVNGDNELLLAKTELNSRDQQLLAMQQQFDLEKQRANTQLASLETLLSKNSQALESNIQFKTASYVLEQHYKSQLDLIAANLRDDPVLNVSLSGFADQRGDNTYNQALSEQRAISVKNYLLSQGVKEQQIVSNSYGESSLLSKGNNYEDDFFDRRVVLKLAGATEEMTAANQ
ncbi:MAG: peptidoglycan-associated lipoprotein [Paraglaciecola sp.]|jgi:peptidoglycan-associated lipoprotein